VFLLFVVAGEKQRLSDLSASIIARTPRPLPPPDLSRTEAVLKRSSTAVAFNLSDNTHKLLNPVRWQKVPNVPWPPMKNPSGSESEKVELTKCPTPLYFVISFAADGVQVTGENRVLYTINVEQQAATRSSGRGRKPFYVAVGDKRDYGDKDKKESFTLREVRGPSNAPTALIIELADSDKQITVTPEQPFKRIDGYMADLRYTPDNKPFPNRRVGDPILGKINIAGEDYNIVAITENEVVLSAAKNQKKTTIKCNPISP
jgi:hypothetical protein